MCKVRKNSINKQNFINDCDIHSILPVVRQHIYTINVNEAQLNGHCW